ncbi:MAG: preprotein translocase subunit YajC [Phycisphaerae bacterium]|nr:preprotein translocase subunit YajC [Phycisphaerae bacterium]NIP50573.1 preprotein translocase subunit YajC [Phycisphaerae bacterium]NIS50784.1 preprotein translocase subunit YajC [Phycisphaerae bacterium]NIU07461.1 preprotein translocase subunit YajC [Phycisphaerae bacterium]NIU55051.1 preprotein translocase subunit YajC [Phycisphaerae bacterium]
MDNVWILAQAESNQGRSGITSERVTEENEAVTTVPSDPNAAPTQQKTKPLIPLWILPVLILVMVFMLFRGPQKQKQQRKQMVQSLKKNDRVQTIGGIIGTIVNIKGDEITLKVDESNNTKITVVSSAIGKNMSKD